MNRLKEYKELEKEIKAKETQLKKENDKVKKAYNALLKEKQDVVDLDESKVSKLFSKLTGSYEDKLEKETYEAKMAENEFIYARQSQIALKQVIDDLIDKQKALIPNKEEYFRLFKEKMEMLMDDPQVINLKNAIIRNQESIQYIQQQRESIRKAISKVADIENKFNIATGASVMDLIGIPYIGEGIKYTQLADIKKHMKELNEILNVLPIQKLGIDENFFAYGVFDVFADNIIVDAIALGKITEQKKKINELEEALNRQLKQNKKDENDYMKLLKRASENLEDYIVKTDIKK